jgi:DNA-binding MarR family transcriptional regulator
MGIKVVTGYQISQFNGKPNLTDLNENILRSMRKITRAIDLHSRKLAANHKLTTPQLICLRQLMQHGPLLPSLLAREISLSQATVTGIIDRLEKRGLVQRRRDQPDRRQVRIHLTEEGQKLIKDAPLPLQERFARSLEKLLLEEQLVIQNVLDRIVVMMEAEDVDAAPVITTGNVEASPLEVSDFLDQPKPADEKE